MAGGAPAPVLRRGESRMRSLRALVRDTQKALSDVADIISIDSEVSSGVHEAGVRASRPVACVLLGRSCSARARLANCLLGRRVLPTGGRGWRWVCLRYGESKQAHLTLGNSEFELVDELECNRHPWEVLPLQDLKRQDETDLSTLLDIELNNTFLKDGVRIIIPPDLEEEPCQTEDLETLRAMHSDFYTNRASILKHYTPIYFYAIDRIGRNCFTEHFCDANSRFSMESSRSDEEFWKTCNMYYMTRAPGTSSVDDRDKCSDSDKVSDIVEVAQEANVELKKVLEESVFSVENCLDLHQVKEVTPKCQIFFTLFADSTDLRHSLGAKRKADTSGGQGLEVEATESTEDILYHSVELPESDQSPKRGDVVYRSPQSTSQQDIVHRVQEQCAFMRELVDQWQLMYCSVPKTEVKNHWMILDDDEILQTNESKLLASYLANAQNTEKIKNPKPMKVEVDGQKKARECGFERNKLVHSRSVLLSRAMKYIAESVQNYLLEYCNKLSEIHVKLLQQFILASFDMAREMQVVPRKIQYVATQEQNLYDTINAKFWEGEKKEELLQIMEQVLQDMKEDIQAMDWCIDDLPCHREQSLIVSNSVFYDNSASVRNKSSKISDTLSIDFTEQNLQAEIEEAVSYDSYNFEDYDIINQDEALQSLQSSQYTMYLPNGNSYVSNGTAEFGGEINSIRVENECDVFSVNSSVLLFGARMLNPNGLQCPNSTQMSIKQASLDVQKTVLTKLSRKISLRLVKFVDCLRDSYFGTLQRCLESLEASCREELGGRPATEAMRQVLSVARQVDLQACASFSVLRSLAEHLRRLFHRLKVGGGGAGASACCVLSPVWRRQVALHTVHTLSPSRLARLISSQILERLSVAHERYQAALETLSGALAGRLHHTEEAKLSIRKRYAPRFARLCLESTSMCDLLMYGAPELGREIGRGQYGVVFSCRGPWAGREPCAIKSVLPCDERHFNELAMEFFYTRSIPHHPRIVRLYGSVVERRPSSCPTVLLVTQRLARDLYCAVLSGDLSFAIRIRVALDIVEGIRYLHSLGLLHRDIKMKNVLLDHENRASLTDLGFCVPEALMSGSVVGTPVHMAPELLTGDYDSSVDVYAFGILFWYVCAGKVKLPSAFEAFQNKEQLWSKVRKGLRPERLPQFSDECWNLMTACWDPVPPNRALLGDVQPVLERILEQSLKQEAVGVTDTNDNDGSSHNSLAWSQDSLHFTGVSRFDVV